uniref:small subunit processome component 20 homolog n=1 Tax=Ciona intestinalis TaxID=7719 RepID=UPI000180BAB2|nr:small subunit processome component 20 homolog [Ciona intestinalis]XP_009860979.1 small subunit processome component 20 homolog [Ciona intestinalis]|eukprot:XP_002120920.1 small subunit processome component 20 homolog [Ciona intestinalis]
MPAPHKHKEKNQFRFKTFSERLSEVNIDAIHQIDHVPLVESGEDFSRFFESMQKWRDLELSLDFVNFRKKISDKCKNYKMVVYYKDDIITALQEHLAVENSLALQALLDIMVSLCIDLSSDFYPHFSKFFKILTTLLQTKDVDKLEWVFSSISMLFRKQWRYMVNDMNNVLDMYMGLFEGEHPEHISNFAAESVSFLLRKAKNPQLVLSKLFKVTVETPATSERLAHVVFNMVKSPQNQFHSCTEDVMPVILSFLKTPDNTGAIYNCINSSIHLMADHTRRKFGKPIWDALILAIKENTAVDSDLPYLIKLLKLLDTWCKCRFSSRLLCHKEFCDVITACQNLVADLTVIDKDEISDAICSVVSTVLHGSKSDLSQTTQKSLIRDLSVSKLSFKAIASFWEKSFALSSFKSLAHDIFLKFCKDNIQAEENQDRVVSLLGTYSMLCNPLPQNGAELFQRSIEIFEFSKFSRVKNEKQIGEILINLLKIETEPEILWNILISLQSVRPLPKDTSKTLLNLYKSLTKSETSDSTLAVIAVVLQTMWTVDKSAPKECKHIVEMLLSNPNRLVLMLADILLTCKPKFSTLFNKNEVLQLLVKLVSSPETNIRVLCLRILQKLDKSNEPIYHACIMAEETDATVHDYRTKLLHLKKLEKHKNGEGLSGDAKEVAIRCLFSQLYINFSHLWKPLQEIIASHATSDRGDKFWEILFEIAEKSSEDAENSKWWLQLPGTSTDQDQNSDFENFVQGKVKKGRQIINSQTDYFNFRLQVWKTMAILPHNNIIDCNNRVIVTLLFRYLDNEYYLLDKENCKVQNLANNSDQENEFFRRKDSVKMLISMLNVFANLNNPSSTIQKDKLLSLFKDLLTHVHTDMQQAALKCLYQYKWKGLTKHKEKICEFFDDKLFRDALTNFEISSLLEDRDVVAPILLRILFGRMRSKTGGSSGGKQNSSTRRSIIIRFLAGVSSSELEDFIYLIVEPYKAVAQSDKNVMEIVEEDVGTRQVVPLARQLGVVNTLQMLLNKLNKQLPLKSYSLILRILLYIVKLNTLHLTQSTNDNDENQLINPKFITPLKSIKKQVQECLITLLTAWPDEAPMLGSQIDEIFDANIWCDLHKLNYESSGHPTVMLKLFKVFATNLRFLPWLARVGGHDGNVTPISVVVETLNSDKTSANVSTFILDILNDVLFSDEEEMEKDRDHISQQIQLGLQSVGGLLFNAKAKIETRLELGILVLQPHMKPIVDFFIEKMRKSKKGLLVTPKQLKLLSLLSENIADKSLLSQLSEILLSHVSSVSSKTTEKSVIPALETLSHVIQGTSLLPKLSKLFSKISDRETRIWLVTVLKAACKSDSQFQWTSDIVTRLNAWDKRFIEEMNFDARLTAFNDVCDKLNKDSDFLFQDNCLKFIPVLHCCLHTMLHLYSDISLRESVSRALTLVIHKVKAAKDREDFKVIYKAVIKDFLLPSVQSGLKSPDEGCRHESVQLLSTLVKTFPDEPLLSGLSVLSNLTNPEDDFFENVRHIQTHRRARAFRKIAKILCPEIWEAKSSEEERMEVVVKDNVLYLSPISYSTAASFLLPLATQTLYTKDLTKLAYLHESCIDVIKSCTRIMPWVQYKKFLLQNIWSLDRHKAAIEVVCGVLQVFPFDLSKFTKKELMFEERGTVDFPEIKDISQEDLGAEDDEDGEEIMIVDESSRKDEKILKLKTKKIQAKIEAENNIVEDEMIVVENETSTKRDLTFEEAQNILADVTGKLIPKLRMILSTKDEADEHKLSNAKSDIDKCCKKIPLAVAIVAILKKMPISTLKSQLPGVVLKVVGFLRHKLHDIRIIACQTVINILQSLGTSYMYLVVKELKSGLTRGYQRHVLVHVINSIFSSMETTFKVGDLDSSLAMILEILNADLFGETAAEKKVEKLRIKIPEARGRSKAYPAYKILVKFISKTCLTSVLQPLKVVMEETNIHGVKKVIKDVLTDIGFGLLENKTFEPLDLLTLMHALLTENISVLFPEKKKENVEEKSTKPGQRPPSCLLLSPEPERLGKKAPPKMSKSNLHLLVEFSLQLLHLSMKRQIVTVTEQEHLQMLDPLVTHITSCLNSAHQQTVVDSIRCVTKLLRTDLPALKDNCPKLTVDLFKILRDHTKGSGNQETAAVSFKCLSVLCSSEYGDQLSKDQLLVLLTYAEEDLYDTQRQSHAFDLIKSILKKGLQCKEVAEVINKVRSIAIQSHGQSSRNQARGLYFHFLMNYPLIARKINSNLEFMLAQLTYEYEDGRASALELVSSVLTNFPDTQVKDHAQIIFISTSSLLLDETQTCRRMAANVIKMLLRRLGSDLKDQLFSFVSQWYASLDNSTQPRLASLLVSIFAEVEEGDLQRHLEDILPLVNRCIEHGMNDDDPNIQRKDHNLFFHMTAFLRILQHCGICRGEKWQATLQKILENVETLATHPHAWIRLVSDQILGTVFSQWQPEELVAHKGYNSYLTCNLENKISALVKKLCSQFHNEILGDHLAEQLIKDLLFLVRVLQAMEAQGGDLLHPDIIWLLRQLQNVTKSEQSNNPKVSAKRTATLKFCAAFSMTFKNNIHCLQFLLDMVHRCINASATHGEQEIEAVTKLQELATEVLEVIKQNSIFTDFTSVYLKVVKKINHKKMERKKERAVQLVSDPKKAALFKLRKQERTKEQRKRKIARLRPEYGLQKSKKAKK